MRFRLATLLAGITFAAILISALLLWEKHSAVHYQGHRAVTVFVVQSEAGNVFYALTDEELVQTTIANHSASESQFRSIDESIYSGEGFALPPSNAVSRARKEHPGAATFDLQIPFFSIQSRFGRELGFREPFDTIIFRLDYQDREPDFRIFKVPTGSDPNVLVAKL